MRDAPRRPAAVDHRFIPLFWRLFIPNATVLVGACVVLIVEPANGRIPALVGGLTVMIVANLALMRRAFAPLTRLATLMHAVDPLEPGQRIPRLGPESEVTVLAEAFNTMLDRIEDERRESGRRALLAEEQERRRLSGELHDEIGQSLTALALELDHVATQVTDDGKDRLAAAKSIAGRTLEDVRRLAGTLRPEVLDQLGLVPALTNLCDRMAAHTRLRIERNLETPRRRLQPESELVIYRVAQESLTNIARHAGASAVRVGLTESADTVELTVVDDGVGIEGAPSTPSGQGIRGMRERAVAIGARLSIVRDDGHGTVVRLSVPLEPGG